MPAVFGKITQETRCSICQEMIPEGDEGAAVEFAEDGDMYTAIVAHAACLVSAKIRMGEGLLGMPADSTERDND